MSLTTGLFLFGSVAFGTVGYLMLKRAGTGWEFIFSPFLWGAGICFFFSMLLFVPVVNAYPSASRAVPLAALTYVALAVVEYFVYGKPLTVSQYAGILLIGTGVYLLQR